MKIYKNIIISMFFILSACGQMDAYRPALVSEPKDKIKYESDLKDCIQYSKDIRSNPDSRSLAIGAFGVIGYAAVSSTASKDDNYFKNGYELTDDCLKQKGYKIISK
jgi:hypothetical protein